MLSPTVTVKLQYCTIHHRRNPKHARSYGFVRTRENLPGDRSGSSTKDQRSVLCINTCHLLWTRIRQVDKHGVTLLACINVSACPSQVYLTYPNATSYRTRHRVNSALLQHLRTFFLPDSDLVQDYFPPILTSHTQKSYRVLPTL